MASRVKSPIPQSSSVASRSSQPSPRQKFDSDDLRAYIKKLIPKTLQGYSWDPKQRERTKAWCAEIGGRIKNRMLEIQPTGYKYIVTIMINENLGQGGRADMVCHWEDSDSVVQEMWMNDSIICICLAFAIQTS
ncbi:hypothetical protein FRC03_003915 [Tulasnella sp. 419]|nr:hypothetical protein FRC02_006723 [Tulasnella sp. 418]KAG8962662.1 hypothetical protein FRC03_003915 [Tulasnella sp. 419]